MPAALTPVRPVAERNALALRWRHLPSAVYRRLARTREGVRRLGPDDALQAGFVGLLRAAELFDEARGFRFSTYAWPAVARHILRAAAGPRGPKSCPLPGDDFLPAPGPVPPAGVDDARLYAALATLPARERRVVTLYYGLGDDSGGRTLEEVAALTGGISRERVRQLLARARGWLREALAGLQESDVKDRGPLVP